MLPTIPRKRTGADGDEVVSGVRSPHTRSRCFSSLACSLTCRARCALRFGAWSVLTVRGISGAGFDAQIPYEVTVGITFDQQQVDTP